MASTIKKVPVHPEYADVTTSESRLNGPDSSWFGTGAAEGYTQVLLERFNERHPDAASELAFIANEAKWSVGWKGFGRQMLEVLD